MRIPVAINSTQQLKKIKKCSIMRTLKTTQDCIRQLYPCRKKIIRNTFLTYQKHCVSFYFMCFHVHLKSFYYQLKKTKPDGSITTSKFALVQPHEYKYAIFQTLLIKHEIHLSCFYTLFLYDPTSPTICCYKTGIIIYRTPNDPKRTLQSTTKRWAYGYYDTCTSRKTHGYARVFIAAGSHSLRRNHSRF